MAPFPWSFASDPASVRPKRAAVAGLLYAGEVAGLVAPPFAGKSVAAARIAVDIVAGRPFLGCSVSAGSVLYVAAEREQETRLRIAAMRAGGPDVPVLGRSGGEGMDLCDRGFVRRLIDTVRHVEDTAGAPLRLLVLDTLARLMPGADEVSARDMGAVADAMARLADAGPAVLALHHPPKSGAGLRGSGALDGAVDRILHLGPGKAGAMVLRVAQANSGSEGTSVSFKIGSAEIGRDESGEPVTVAVVQEIESAGASPVENARARAVLGLLAEASGKVARRDTLAALRAAGAVSANPASAAEQLRRTLAAMRGTDVLDYDADLIWLTRNGNPNSGSNNTPSLKGEGIVGLGCWPNGEPNTGDVGVRWGVGGNEPTVADGNAAAPQRGPPRSG